MAKRIEDVLAALAAKCEDVTGIRSLYPMRPEAPTKLTLVIMAGALNLTRTGNEQRWLFRGRGLLMIPNTGETHKHAREADAALTPIVDAFDPKDGVEHYQLGGLVQRCQFVEANLYQAIQYAGSQFVGHELFWDIDARRFKGDA